MYYLNHVGYKASHFILHQLSKSMYYLNHVGYKVISRVLLSIPASEYYLNHVGYKSMLYPLAWNKCLCIIWTMWDIKFVEPRISSIMDSRYYLNHVGYKVFILKLIFALSPYFRWEKIFLKNIKGQDFSMNFQHILDFKVRKKLILQDCL